MAQSKALLLTPCGIRLEIPLPIYRDQVERLVDGWVEIVHLSQGALLCSDTFLRDRMPRNASAEALVPGKCICGPVVILSEEDFRRFRGVYSWQKGGSAALALGQTGTGAHGTVDIRKCDTCKNEYVSTVGSFERDCYPCRRRFGGDGLVRNARGQLVPPETVSAIEAE